MTLDRDDVIDASRVGGLTRFLNHSCGPNAEAQNWTVNGERRVAIVAQRPIAKDDEVTFDYAWASSDAPTTATPVAAEKRCLCGAKECRGVLGDRDDALLANLCDDSDKRWRKAVADGRAKEPVTGAVVASAFGHAQGEVVERTVDRWWRDREARDSATVGAGRDRVRRHFNMPWTAVSGS